MKDTGEQTQLEFLIFELDGRHFGLPTTDVLEIVRVVPPIPLPGAPAVIEGVINVRGSVVPVLNVRRRFDLPDKPLQHTDHLVIARIAGRQIALRVDRALGLSRLAQDDVEDLRGVTSSASGIGHVAKLPDDLVLVSRDLKALLSLTETVALDEAISVSSYLAVGGKGG